MDKSSSQSEFEIIRRYFANPNLSFKRDGIELGIGDDAALIDVPANKHLAMSMDVLISGIHFSADADPALIANRALAVNLSDLAAMAAQPYCFTLGLVLPDSDETWLQKFSEGLASLARQYNCPLVGGDTSRGPLSISIQVQGLVDRSQAARRSAANSGDKIYVSGNLGDGAVALLALGLDSHLGSSFSFGAQSLSDQDRQYFSDAFFKPQPQLELAAAAGKLFSSCIDISDGLQGDLGHILAASSLAATINIDALPYSMPSQRCMDTENRIVAALFGGDDYQLCFTVPEGDCAELERLARDIGVKVSCIGEIVSGEGVAYLDTDGAPVDFSTRAYQHFASVQSA